MLRWLIAFMCLIASAAAPAMAEVAGLTGTWRGAATLNGDATDLLVEFERCDETVCAYLSMPELEYARLPLGPAAEEESGALRAGNLLVTLQDDRLTGVLSGHGPVFLDAMGHGGEAQVTLERGRASRREFIEEDITFNNGDVALSGTLVLPRGRGPHPAIVAVLGSGPATRWASLGRARQWARLGYAVLIYDKRGTGGSGGNWLAASLDDLADDAAAAIRHLQMRRDIRAQSIGFWGHSQGGWVAPRAIARGAPAAFLVAVSGGGTSPQEVERYDYASTLDRLAVTGGERQRADALVDSYVSYLRGDIDLPAMRAALAQVREASWYRPLGLSRVIPDEAARGQWRWVATYDPASDLAALRVPVFAVLGGEDRPSLVPGAVSVWRATLAQRTDAQVVVYPGADHHMRVRAGEGWRRVSPAYERALDNFLREQASR
jgi:dienelactone hydrolase